MFPAYRSQLFDLHRKSADWFLYYGIFGEAHMIFFEKKLTWKKIFTQSLCNIVPKEES